MVDFPVWWATEDSTTHRTLPGSPEWSALVARQSRNASELQRIALIVRRISPPPMSGAELAEKHGFTPHGRDPLGGPR
jgi:hypothetical protein